MQADQSFHCLLIGKTFSHDLTRFSVHFSSMKTITLSLVFWLLLICYFQNADSVIKRAHKHCLFECANCMVLWGSDLYDGKRCAACCHYSNGKVTDPECKRWANGNKLAKRGGGAMGDVGDFDIEKYLSRFKGLLPDYCFV